MNQIVEQAEFMTPTVEGFLEDFNGVPYPQFFGQKEAFKSVSLSEYFGWYVKLWGSYIWYAANLDGWALFMEIISGEFKELGFFNKLIWILYRGGYLAIYGLGSLNYDAGVYHRNYNFLGVKAYASTASSLWFVVFFGVNLFWRITAGGLFEFDFDEIDEKGLDYSINQATAYHYWEDKEAHGLFTMLWVNLLDWINVFYGIYSLLAYTIIYWLVKGFTILFFPWIALYKVFTPWKEQIGETPVMWWVDAIELGLYDPMNPPTNMWEIEDARTQALSIYDDVDTDE